MHQLAIVAIPFVQAMDVSKAYTQAEYNGSLYMDANFPTCSTLRRDTYGLGGLQSQKEDKRDGSQDLEDGEEDDDTATTTVVMEDKSFDEFKYYNKDDDEDPPTSFLSYRSEMMPSWVHCWNKTSNTSDTNYGLVTADKTEY